MYNRNITPYTMRTYDRRKEAIQKYQRSEKGVAALTQAGERWRARRRAVRVELKALMRSWDKAWNQRPWDQGSPHEFPPKEYTLPLDELLKVLRRRVEAETGWTLKDSQIIAGLRGIVDAEHGHLGCNTRSRWYGTPAAKALKAI
jgi:hypothetical protein